MISNENVEGATPLEPEELAGLKFKHITTRRQLDELEQANIVAGLLWLKKSIRRDDVLSLQFAFELHKALFKNVWTWAGSFRLTEKNIGIDPINISVDLIVSIIFGYKVFLSIQKQVLNQILLYLYNLLTLMFNLGFIKPTKKRKHDKMT